MYLNSLLIIGSQEPAENKLAEIVRGLGIEPAANHPNIVHLTPDEEKIGIGIEKIRELRSALSIKPPNSQPKIAIVSNAETLTEEAQNALLKTLEEPPANTYLVLLAKNANWLLPTVISRCQTFELSATKDFALSKEENEGLAKVIGWIEEGSIPHGFAWAAENTDRKSALTTIDKLIVASRKLLLDDAVAPETILQLFEAKKYLLANTNVRLTLENLFI